MIAGAAPQGHARASRWPHPTKRHALALAVALGAPGLVTLLAFTDVRTVVPGLLYIVAIILATIVGGRLGGLVAVAASAFPFFYFFASRYDRNQINGEGATALAIFILAALFGSEVLRRERDARERAERAVRESRSALDAATRLQNVADALATAHTPQEVLDAVLTEGVRAAEAHGGLITTLSDDGEWLEVIASRGYDLKWIEPFRRFPVSGDYPLSEAVRTGEGVFIRSEAERDERYPELVGRSQPGHGLVCVPLVGERGKPIGGLVFSFPTDQDFTPERRALKIALARQAALALERARFSAAEQVLRDRLSFLSEATALLTSSLELDRTLERLVQLAVPQLADWCAIAMLVEETGEIEQLVVAHQDPERQRWAEEMQASSRTIMIDDEFDLTARVIRTAEPVFLREIPQELLDEAVERDPNAARALEEISLRSAITLPLRSGERIFGALTLVSEVRELQDSDFELAQELAARAAIAVENARLYREAERRAEAALALAYVGDGVILLDEDGRVRFWNAAAAAITGVREAEAIGRRPAEVLPAWEELTRLAEVADAATERARPVTVPIETASRDRWVAVTGVAFDEGVVYTLRDVSDEQAFERARSDFVATASHELRTPLAAVYGAARTLRRTDIVIPAEQHDRFLEIIVSETERLTAIVSQILLAGQLEEGRVDVATAATDLRPLAESTLDSARLRAPEQIGLRLEQNGTPAVALADEDKLRQVVVNLLDNAIKYSPDGGDVTVELAGGHGRVRLTVRDCGLGIPQGEQERIFEKFYRLDPALTRGVGGSGLGLFISRELVSRMGGSLTVRSQPGQGAAFVVDLPAA
ncbi:MAG TPA: ATP-binding protein [Gaiellaceae bacterium]|jgi:PAS domain S-box-containing protein|nr:ATP-binding protein [Gaiellaceae bacterium]